MTDLKKKLIIKIEGYVKDFEEEFGVLEARDTWEEESYQLLKEVLVELKK